MKKVVYDRQRRFWDTLLKARVPFLNRWGRDRLYDLSFYEEANQLKQASAAQVAQIICCHFVFQTVFDIGCGMGLYLEEFRRLGKEVVGCDTSRDGLKMSSQAVTIFLADATKPIVMNRRFDLVLCFEVAEHIRSRHSRQLVLNCTSAAEQVLFTAAPPGQGGVGHINERLPGYWIDLFRDQGFVYDFTKSETVRARMTEAKVVPWIATNLMYFQRAPIS